MTVLNEKQQEAVDSVMSGDNILLTGSAGTGKSFTVKYIIDVLKTNKKKYALTAPTGTAAIIIGGMTIHSFMGIGLGKGKTQDIVKKIYKNKIIYDNLVNLEVLIIDEISMLDNELFEKISSIFSIIHSNYKKDCNLLDIPFGGIQLIFIGDFCQLAPVSGLYCFLSLLWDKLNIRTILLDKLIRQSDDLLFQQILQITRKGKCTDNILKVLNSLKDTKFSEDIIPTKLFPLNIDVDKINNIELEKMKQTGNKSYNYIATASNDNLKKAKKYDIELIEMSQIIITRNINFHNGVVNGTRGIIIELREDSVIIKDVFDKVHIISYYKDICENSANSYISHMPINISYALTIHKAQGMTIDALELDLGTNIFTPGQAYTALSRARNLQSIKIINVDKDSFNMNPYVKKFYKTLTT